MSHIYFLFVNIQIYLLFSPILLHSISKIQLFKMYTLCAKEQLKWKAVGHKTYILINVFLKLTFFRKRARDATNTYNEFFFMCEERTHSHLFRYINCMSQHIIAQGSWSVLQMHCRQAFCADAVAKECVYVRCAHPESKVESVGTKHTISQAAMGGWVW